MREFAFTVIMGRDLDEPVKITVIPEDADQVFSASRYCDWANETPNDLVVELIKRYWDETMKLHRVNVVFETNFDGFNLAVGKVLMKEGE